MAVEHNRSRLAGLRSVEAGLHVHRRAEAVRAAARGRPSAPVARPSEDSALSGWWQGLVGTALWWRITKRFAGAVSRLMRGRWVRRIGIGVAAVGALFVLVAGG